MMAFHILPTGKIELIVDRSIYDDWVIDKVLYWWSSEYLITRNNSDDLRIQTIVLTPKSISAATDVNMVINKISNDFIDYKNRDRKSTRLNSSHRSLSRMPSSA